MFFAFLELALTKLDSGQVTQWAIRPEHNSFHVQLVRGYSVSHSMDIIYFIQVDKATGA